ncbi:predicted protein [Chaetomium globosum CBS 148.51]|uniref:Uncharacterized protein n=1 Tax=Chaetomium globosum (strain ATCC 6205 / CBS 148.51 / DSM 1962 / NBRC 6347 / NRRL 1970) TaxID=306901 RepID=Q2GU00_CHAGB|nr:uncharacterized protein CHGG_08554 [Chaetomium globosum CBS 148.51]EAQ84540.1 predicted protein [Chaetomium globosum CBS 148.51]
MAISRPVRINVESREVSVRAAHHDYGRRINRLPGVGVLVSGISVRAHWSNADLRDGMSFVTSSSGLGTLTGNINMHHPTVAIFVEPGLKEGNGRHMANLGAEHVAREESCPCPNLPMDNEVSSSYR